MRQLALFAANTKTEFGGNLLVGKRKTTRPLGIKKSNHLVLKAKNPFLLLRNSKQTGEILNQYARRFEIQIFSYAVHGDHVHISFKIPSRASYQKWIRSVTSILVQKINGLKFSLRPWSRIVAWGRALKRVLAYIQSNKLEADLILEAVQIVENFRGNFLKREFWHTP